MSKAHRAGHRDARAAGGGRAAYPGAIWAACKPSQSLRSTASCSTSRSTARWPRWRATVARWIADPSGGLLHPLWFLAGGAITLLLGGLPFRLPQQYWRFSGIADLLGVAGAASSRRPCSPCCCSPPAFRCRPPTFPIVHALTLIGRAGRAARLLPPARPRPRGVRRAGCSASLLVGAGDGADLFLRALERGGRAPPPRRRPAGPGGTARPGIAGHCRSWACRSCRRRAGRPAAEPPPALGPGGDRARAWRPRWPACWTRRSGRRSGPPRAAPHRAAPPPAPWSCAGGDRGPAQPAAGAAWTATACRAWSRDAGCW